MDGVNLPSLTLWLRCPECHEADALECEIVGYGRDVTVSLLSQTCLCDPFNEWEDVWEQAREIVYETRAIDEKKKGA